METFTLVFYWSTEQEHSKPAAMQVYPQYNLAYYHLGTIAASVHAMILQAHLSHIIKLHQHHKVISLSQYIDFTFYFTTIVCTLDMVKPLDVTLFISGHFCFSVVQTQVILFCNSYHVIPSWQVAAGNGVVAVHTQVFPFTSMGFIKHGQANVLCCTQPPLCPLHPARRAEVKE